MQKQCLIVLFLIFSAQAFAQQKIPSEKYLMHTWALDSTLVNGKKTVSDFTDMSQTIQFLQNHIFMSSEKENNPHPANWKYNAARGEIEIQYPGEKQILILKIISNIGRSMVVQMKNAPQTDKIVWYLRVYN